MRSILTIALTLAVMPYLSAQGESDTTKVDMGKKNIVTVTEEDDGTEVKVQDDFVIVDDRNDTVKIKLGNKAISITEDGDKTRDQIRDQKRDQLHNEDGTGTGDMNRNTNRFEYRRMNNRSDMGGSMGAGRR